MSLARSLRIRKSVYSIVYLILPQIPHRYLKLNIVWNGTYFQMPLHWSLLVVLPRSSKSCVYAQLCPTLCDPLDCSPPGSSIHRISQARILEWVAISSSRGSFWPRDPTCASWVTGMLSHWENPAQSHPLIIPLDGELYEINDIVYALSKSPTYEQVLFWECIHKSNTLSPTKLALGPNQHNRLYSTVL